MSGGRRFLADEFIAFIICLNLERVLSDIDESVGSPGAFNQCNDRLRQIKVLPT